MITSWPRRETNRTQRGKSLELAAWEEQWPWVKRTVQGNCGSTGIILLPLWRGLGINFQCGRGFLSHHQAVLQTPLGILPFNSALTLSTWRSHQISHVKGSVTQTAPSLHIQMPLVSSGHHLCFRPKSYRLELSWLPLWVELSWYTDLQSSRLILPNGATGLILFRKDITREELQRSRYGNIPS